MAIALQKREDPSTGYLKRARWPELDQAPGREVAHQRAGAEGPGLDAIGALDPVDERAELGAIDLVPDSTKPSSPSTLRATVVRRSWSRVNVSSSSRMNGPIAHDALLSLALLRSSALRPSKSRRFTSLPSVAPTISPRSLTARTTSGSGLFQVDS